MPPPTLTFALVLYRDCKPKRQPGLHVRSRAIHAGMDEMVTAIGSGCPSWHSMRVGAGARCPTALRC